MARKRLKLQAATKLKLEQIVRLQAINRAPQEMASLMGMDVATINDLMATDDFRVLQKEYTSVIYANFDKMVENRNAGFLMEHAAPDAAEALLALLSDDDSVTRRLSAVAILDRSGHGPIQRRAVRHRHELDPVSAALLGKAMQESNAIDVEAIEAEIVKRESVVSNES